MSGQTHGCAGPEHMSVVAWSTIIYRYYFRTLARRLKPVVTDAGLPHQYRHHYSLHEIDRKRSLSGHRTTHKTKACVTNVGTLARYMMRHERYTYEAFRQHKKPANAPRVPIYQAEA